MGTTNPIPPPVFQGQSKFSSDFQQVLTRAVNIASLPLQQMQNELSTLTAQQSALSGLSNTFNSLQTSLLNIGVGVDSVSAVSSNSAAVSATATTGALPGTYTIQVSTLGSSTTTISSAGSPAVTDPTSGNISSSTSFTLTVNGANTTVKPSGTSLDALATAINSAGAGVQATIVNVGSSSSADYRLSVTSTRLAADTIQLNDGTTNLLSTLSTGAATSYTVNGVSTTSNSQQVTLAPGLTVNLLQQTTSPATITVAQNSSALSNSLSSFATAYNAAVDAINQQHGQNAGPLAGQSTILSLSQALSSINQYNGGGNGLMSLSSIGLNIDATGHLSFDPTVLSGLSTATVQQFLGSVTSGGFLQSANNALTSLTDPTSGVFPMSLNSIQGSINNENTQISQQQDQINTLQANLQKQLSAADATIAVLESQVTYMSNLFATMYPNVSSTGTSGGANINGG